MKQYFTGILKKLFGTVRVPVSTLQDISAENNTQKSNGCFETRENQYFFALLLFFHNVYCTCILQRFDKNHSNRTQGISLSLPGYKGYPYPCQYKRDILLHFKVHGFYSSFLYSFELSYNYNNVYLFCFKMNLDFYRWTAYQKMFFFLNYLYLFDWRNSNTHGGNLYAFSIHSFMTLIKKQFDQYLIREIFMNYL